jgi:hypothetical protein
MSMRDRSASWRGRMQLGAALGALGSLIVHALAFFVLRWAGTMPELDFDLELPSEVEFGVSQAPTAEEPLAAPAAAPEPPPSAAAPSAITAKSEKRKPPAEPDAGIPDAAAELPTDAAADAGAPGEGDRPVLSAYAPAGAQIALRVHMGRVRESELAPDVRSLLEAVADWRLILEGSGLDPLRDLERLYIASPDLQRAHLVIAGQYVGGEEVARRAVEAMATARGEVLHWRKYGAVRVAPWYNLDQTARVLALIAPRQFAITRSEDLPRVLQVARALAQRRAADKAAPKPEVDPAEALLALDKDETLALSVEGARLFARGNVRGVPERLEASVRSLEDGTALDVRVTGHFEDARSAEQAQVYWERVRERYAGHPLVALIGLRAPLADASVAASESAVEARTRVTLEQARVVLGFIRNAVAPPPPAPRLEAPADQPPDGEQPPRSTGSAADNDSAGDQVRSPRAPAQPASRPDP